MIQTVKKEIYLLLQVINFYVEKTKKTKQNLDTSHRIAVLRVLEQKSYNGP